MKGLSKSLIFRFAVVGLLSVTIDWSIYLMGTRWLGIPFWIDKAFSFLCGTFFSFILNGIWTFRAKLTGRKLGKHLCVYGLSLTGNVATNQALLSLLIGSLRFQREFALLAATSVSTAINYIGLKMWVFSSSDRSSVEFD